MTCRHARGDRSCTTQYPRPPKARKTPPTPDKDDYDIMDVVAIEGNLVLKVKYPSCRSCAYEGIKVMVFRGVSALDAIKWKRIDPHFRDPRKHRLPSDAPPPVARFPGNEEGWVDAQAWAAFKPHR